MKVVVREGGRVHSWDMVDTFDAKTKLSSMSRTTGYTCTAAAELILKGLFSQKGVFPPESVGADKVHFEFILHYLAERGVNWRHTVH